MLKRNKVILAKKKKKKFKWLTCFTIFSLVSSRVAPRLQAKEQIKIGMNIRKQMWDFWTLNVDFGLRQLSLKQIRVLLKETKTTNQIIFMCSDLIFHEVVLVVRYRTRNQETPLAR